MKVQLDIQLSLPDSYLEGNMPRRSSRFKGITCRVSCQGSLHWSWLQHLHRSLPGLDYHSYSRTKWLRYRIYTIDNVFSHQFPLLTTLIPSATPGCWYRPKIEDFRKLDFSVKMKMAGLRTFAWHFAPFHQYLTACQELEERKLTLDWGEMEERLGWRTGEGLWQCMGG